MNPTDAEEEEERRRRANWNIEKEINRMGQRQEGRLKEMKGRVTGRLKGREIIIYN